MVFPEDREVMRRGCLNVVHLDVEGGADLTNRHGGQRNAECRFLLFRQSAGLLHDTMPSAPLSPSRVGDVYLRSLMVGFALWDINLLERQECPTSAVPEAT